MAHPWMDSTRPVYPGTVREGYLIKSPPLDKKGVKQWKKRWCVFTSTGHEPACLLYFTDREAVLTGRMPIKRVCLDACFKVEQALQHSHHRNVFAMHLPERVYYFSAPSHQEMLQWAEALSTHLKLRPQDEARSASRIEGWATLPRASKGFGTEYHNGSATLPASQTSLSLSGSLAGAQSVASKRDQPLPPLPYPPTPPSVPKQVSSQDLPPPLPHRPDILKHSKSTI